MPPGRSTPGAGRRPGRRRGGQGLLRPAARTVCETAIQVHGGIGNTWECMAHVYLRRALLSTTCSAGSGRVSTGCSSTTGSEVVMDFGDSPDEAEFRLRLRAWLDGHNPGLPASSTDDAYWAGQAAWHRSLYEGGFFGCHVADGDRRSGLPSVYDVIVDEELAAAEPRPIRAWAIWWRASSSTAATRSRPASCPGSSTAGPLVPGLQRARRRIRPGLAADPGRARRRRVRHHRPQGVDELLRRRRVVPGPGPHRPRGGPAPGHLGVRRAHGPARDRAAAVAHDQRDHQGVRRGALRRCPGAGGQHDRRCRARVATGHDRREPRARAQELGYAGRYTKLVQRLVRPGARRPGPVRTQSRSGNWPGLSSRSEMLRLHVRRRLSTAWTASRTDRRDRWTNCS